MAVSGVRPSSSTEEEEASSKGKGKKRSSSILGTLREAIKKVRFLLSFSATRWMLLTSACASRGPARRALSFDSRPPGLLDAEGGIASPASSRTSRSASMGTATTKSLSRASSASSPSPSPSPSPQVLTRASSSSGGSPASGGDDDIDQRAEQFIANFYRQLQMERQVSLRLRYVRGNSWDRTP